MPELRRGPPAAVATGMPGFSRSQRAAIAIVVGLVAGPGCFIQVSRANHAHGVGRWGQDFTYPWRAAQALRAGVNPYQAMRPVPGSVYPFANNLAYPLTAAAVVSPLANVNADVAAAIFEGIGFALAAYGLIGLATWRLLVLVSAPALWALHNGQWAPLLIGATLVPWFGGLLACKPTIGAALFFWRPDRRILWGGIALVALCFLAQPSWLADWLDTTRHNPDVVGYVPPIRMLGGPILALALLRWRRPEARLLFVMACVPQNVYFSDQLTLFLIPQSALELGGYVAWSHLIRQLAVAAQLQNDFFVVSKVWAPYILWGIYLPALAMVLRRPNTGQVPAWVEKGISMWPPMLRGSPATSRA